MSKLKTTCKTPKTVPLEAGKTYFWCACGQSSKQPFCDGTHRSTATGLKSLPFNVEEPTAAALCCCGKTNSPPYCDGSHALDPSSPAPQKV